jgi:hypothetical protein
MRTRMKDQATAPQVIDRRAQGDCLETPYSGRDELREPHFVEEFRRLGTRRTRPSEVQQNEKRINFVQFCSVSSDSPLAFHESSEFRDQSAFHDSSAGSGRCEEAQAFRQEEDGSLVTSAAPVQGFTTRSDVSADSLRSAGLVELVPPG